MAANNNTLIKGLVGYWRFDGKDMAGNISYDKSGQGNNGTLTNGPVRGIGKLGQGLNFDGVNDYVNLGTGAPALDLTTAKTIIAWVYPRSLGGANEGAVFVIGNQVYLLMCSNNVNGCPSTTNTFVYGSRDSAANGNVWSPTANNTIRFNEWQHVAVTHVCSDTNAVLYYNGQQVAITKVQSALAECADTTGVEKNIGRDPSAPTQLFDGLIDDVRIYNRALSSDEIKRLYNMGR